MTIADRRPFLTVAALLTVAFVAACSSSGSKAQPGPTTVTSTSVVPSTTNSMPKPVPLACPAHAPSRIAPRQQPGSAVTVTFVRDHPSELLVCRYHGFNQSRPVGSLATSARLAPDAIVAELNAARPEPKGTISNCPADFGEMILLIFGYPDGSRRTVSISTAGCEFANNGDRSVFTPVALLTRLESVVGHDNL